MFAGSIGEVLKRAFQPATKAMHNTAASTAATTAMVGFSIGEREGKMGNAKST